MQTTNNPSSNLSSTSARASGPWKVANANWLLHSCHYDAPIIAPNVNGGHDVIAECKKADASLIAAAPEMLAELKSAERWLAAIHSDTDEGIGTELRDVHSAAWECIDRIRAAIAKAEGQQLRKD